MIRIIFCGSSGKMGSFLCKKLTKIPSFKIVGIVDAETKLLEEVMVNSTCDVVVDFTNAKACYYHAMTALMNNCHFVSGTTGLDKKQLQNIARISKKRNLSVTICPNFTKGINFIKELLPKLRTLYPLAQIEEKHHITKLDAPSGTALMLEKKYGKEIPIKSFRLKKKCATHKIILEDKKERLTIIHEVMKKDAYIDMVVKAIKNCGKFSGLRDYV